MNRLTSITISLILFFCMIAHADDGGSGYSRFGIGDLRYFATSRAMGMGGASIAVMPANGIDQLNPAGWAHINSMRYSVGLLYEGYSTTDGARSSFLSTASFNNLMIALPINVSSGIVFGAGITPYSKVNYNIISFQSLNGSDYTLQHLGKGGLSQTHFGLSASLGSELNFGAKLNYYFGTLHHSVSQTFASTQFTSAEVERATRLKGIGFTFGTVYTGLIKVLKLPENTILNLGITFTTTSYLSSTEERFYKYSTGSLTTRDTTTLPESHIRLPYSLGVGISYQADRWLLAGDLFYQNWSNYDARGGKPAELRDSYRFSTGTEILPKRDATAPFLQRLAYRFGLFYNASYYRIQGEPINEIGFTGGFGIPILRDTRLNIAAEYSFRGTTDFQLQKDKILRISFTLSGGELWFVRTEEE